MENKTYPNRKPQGGVHAYVKDRGRAWVESIHVGENWALIRFDCADRMRSRVHKVSLDSIDFTREWKF